MENLGPSFSKIFRLIQGNMCSGSGQLLIPVFQLPEHDINAYQSGSGCFALPVVTSAALSSCRLLSLCHAREHGRKSSRASCRLSKHSSLPEMGRGWKEVLWWIRSHCSRDQLFACALYTAEPRTESSVSNFTNPLSFLLDLSRVLLMLD